MGMDFIRKINSRIKRIYSTNGMNTMKGAEGYN